MVNAQKDQTQASTLYNKLVFNKAVKTALIDLTYLKTQEEFKAFVPSDQPELKPYLFRITTDLTGDEEFKMLVFTNEQELNELENWAKEEPINLSISNTVIYSENIDGEEKVVMTEHKGRSFGYERIKTFFTDPIESPELIDTYVDMLNKAIKEGD